MLQILELKPPDFTSILDQFKGLTDLSFPTNLSPDFADFPIPKVEAIASTVGSFRDIVQKLPTEPKSLVKDLLTELETLSSGSLDVVNRLSSLTTATETTAPLLKDFKTVFDQLNTNLFPTLGRLPTQEVNAAYLAQLLQPPTPDNQLTGVLQTRLKTAQEIQSLISQFPEDKGLADYQNTLAALAAIPLDSTLTKAHLAVLDDTTEKQITDTIKRLQQQAQLTLDKLNAFDGERDSFSKELTVALDSSLSAIAPQKLGATVDIFQGALAGIGELDLGSITAKIQPAIQTLSGLVGKKADQVTQAIETGVSTIEKAIATAEQALVKVSAIASNLVQQLKGFIQKLNLSSLIDQLKQIFDDLAGKVNGILDKVNQLISQVYTFIQGIVQKIAAIDLRPLVEALNTLLFKITTLLDRQDVRDALDKAKNGLNEVVKQLDNVSLKPVFDQVIGEADNVKAKLEAVDLSQLNPMLKTALKTALDPIKTAIDPKTVTEAVNAEYDKIVTDGLIVALINPIKSQIDKILNIINQFEPGTLIDQALTPPFEAMKAKLRELIDPDKIAKLLQPLTDFQKNLLNQLEETLNPRTLLDPLVKLYNQLLTFVQSLSPQQLLKPLNELLTKATSQLNQLGLETIISKIITSVRQITNLVSSFNLKEQAFWQPIQTILDKGLEPFLNQFVQRIRTAIDSMDLSALQSVLKPLQAAATTLFTQVSAPELLHQVEAIVSNSQAYAKTYLEQMTQLAQTWQQQKKRLADFTPSPALAADYKALQARVEAISPIAQLGALTERIDAIKTGATLLVEHLRGIWQTLTSHLTPNRQHLDNLLANNADTLKNYLRQVLDNLIDGSVKKTVQGLGQPLANLKGAIQSILGLQDYLDVFNRIPESMERIGKVIIGVKDKLVGFNLNFLTDALQGVMDEVVKPLEALNPKTMLIAPVETIYTNILKTLKRINPSQLIASARGTVTLTPEAGAGEIILPRGIGLIAKTPIGEIYFETVAEVRSTGNAPINVSVQALIPGRSSDVVVVNGVTWRVEAGTTTLPTLTVTSTEPILSLTTLAREVILQKLEVLNPVKLIATPLNEQYQKIKKLKDELGLDKIFDVLFTKLDSINQELKEGLDRLVVALSGLLAAIQL